MVCPLVLSHSTLDQINYLANKTLTGLIPCPSLAQEPVNHKKSDMDKKSNKVWETLHHFFFNFLRAVSVFDSDAYLSVGKTISTILLETPMDAHLLSLPVNSILTISHLLDVLIFFEH